MITCELVYNFFFFFKKSFVFPYLLASMLVNDHTTTQTNFLQREKKREKIALKKLHCYPFLEKHSNTILFQLIVADPDSCVCVCFFFGFVRHICAKMLYCITQLHAILFLSCKIMVPYDIIHLPCCNSCLHTKIFNNSKRGGFI